MRRMTEPTFLPRLLPAVVALVAVLAVACGGGSGTTEVEGAAEATTVPLPPPTFPGPTEAPAGGAGPGAAGEPAEGSVDASELIRRIDSLTNETDLCTLLTGQAAAIAGADVNLSSLASNPSALAQLFASLDKLFAHMVDIAPPEVQSPLVTTQQLWQTASTLDLQSGADQQQFQALIAGPEVQAAQDQLGSWITANCT